MGHDELLDALGAEGATGAQRLQDGVTKARNLMGASAPGVASPAAIRARALLPAVTVGNTDTVGGTGFLDNPSAHGYPDATNTGYRGDLADLTVVNGTLEIQNANIELNNVVVATRPSSGSTVWGPVTLFPDRTDISLADFTGTLQSKSAFHVNVADSRLRAPAGVTGGHTVSTAGQPGFSSITTFTDCTFDGLTRAANATAHRLTFVRCDIRGCEDALDAAHQIVVEDSYLHDLVRPTPDAHADIFQVGSTGSGLSGITVTHSTLRAATRIGGWLQFPDGMWDPMNAVLMIGNYAGSVGQVTIDDCLCDGGNYTFNDNWRPLATHPNNYVSGPITVRNCRMGRHFQYGVKNLTDYPDAQPADLPTWDWVNNVWDDTGEAV